MLLAGATRAVNPQMMGGRRMATFALQPHVTEFIDLAMHDEELDFAHRGGPGRRGLAVRRTHAR